MPLDISLAPIRVMEPAIVARLRLAFTEAAGFSIERVPQVMTLTEFGSHAGRTPFLGLAWVGFKPDGDNARLTKGDMLWRLILIYRASNTMKARFKGDARDLGLDAMIDVAIVLLNGAVFDNIGTSHVTGANSIIADGWTKDDTVIAQVDFSVKFTAPLATLNLKTPADFQQLGITWHIDGDNVADEQTITLPPEAPED